MINLCSAAQATPMARAQFDLDIVLVMPESLRRQAIACSELVSEKMRAGGAEYGYNPHGAVEIYFMKSAAWHALQRAVIVSVEPLRRGRLREVDPSGARIRDLVNSTSPEDSRRQQLLRYGYDEVADAVNGGHDRFNPHVTLAWPRDPDYHVALDGLPAPRSFSGPLTELAVFGMSAYGTCTKNYGVFSLG
jgi:hypothetical protein